MKEFKLKYIVDERFNGNPNQPVKEIEIIVQINVRTLCIIVYKDGKLDGKTIIVKNGIIEVDLSGKTLSLIGNSTKHLYVIRLNDNHHAMYLFETLSDWLDSKDS